MEKASRKFYQHKQFDFKKAHLTGLSLNNQTSTGILWHLTITHTFYHLVFSLSLTYFNNPDVKTPIIFTLVKHANNPACNLS